MTAMPRNLKISDTFPQPVRASAPPAAEAESDYGRHIAFGWSVVLAMLAGFVAWAWLAPLSAAAIGGGTVVVDSARKSVQHLEGGIVKELRVRDGDEVEAGATLAVLDDTQARARLKLLEGRLDAARISMARLAAERERLERFELPADLAAREPEDPELGSIAGGERQLFEARRNMLLGQVSVLQNRIEQSQSQIRGLEIQRTAKQQQIVLLQKELAGLQSLGDKGYAPANKILAYQREEAQLEADRGAVMVSVAGVRQAIGEAELQIAQIEKAFLENVEKSMKEVQGQLSDLQQQVLAARDQLQRLVITAPASGQVVDMAVHTVGGVVAPGDRILDVVPRADTLVIDAQLATTDIEDVRVGQAATVQFSAFGHGNAPAAEATVTRVSADRLVDPRSGQPYYLVRVAIADAARQGLDGLTLVPGMPADVIIRKRDRSFAEYLLGPLGATLAKAMRQ